MLRKTWILFEALSGFDVLVSAKGRLSGGWMG